MPDAPEFQLSNSHATIRPLRVDGGLDVDDAGRTEVAERELLGARPHDLHRFAGGLRETRGFDRVLAGVLAAVAGPISGEMTRTRASGIRTLQPARCGRRTAAAYHVHTVTLPSVHSATAERGSSGTCAMYGIR